MEDKYGMRKPDKVRFMIILSLAAGVLFMGTGGLWRRKLAQNIKST